MRIISLLWVMGFSLLLASESFAQICENGTPHPAGLVEDGAYPESETIWGHYFLNETQGSREGGSSATGNVDWLVVRDGIGNVRGSAPVDDNGNYLINLAGYHDEILSDFTFGICDYQDRVTLSAVLHPNENLSQTPVFSSPVFSDQKTPLNLVGESYPEDPETWDQHLPDRTVAPTEDSMIVWGYVTVHGLVSEDPIGQLGAFWTGTTPDGQHGQWLLGEASPSPNSSGRMIYRIEIKGFNFGDDIVFVQVAEDPRTRISGHVGVGRDTFNFIPGSRLGTPGFPLEIVLLHPPFLKPEIPGQVILEGGHFDSIDLRSFVVDPTGQKIDFRVLDADYLFTELDSLDMLHVSYPTGWSGVDRIRVEATHDTREKTIREIPFVVAGRNSRLAHWSDPAPGWFSDRMKVVAAFDSESRVGLDNYPIVAALINGQVRAADTGRRVGDDVIFDLDVQSDSEGDEVRFALYTVSNDQLKLSSVSFPFSKDAVIGSVQDPVRLGTVTTDLHGFELELPSQPTLTALYPNPASRTSTVHIQAAHSSHLDVWITDLLGKRTLVKSIAQPGAGAIEFDLDVTSLASGIYHVSIETDGFKDTKPLVVVK